MIHNASFSEGIEPVEKIDYTVRDIDLILKDRFYLVKHTVFSKWLGIRSDWEENYEKNRQQLVDNVIDLRNLLADIYNNELHQEYKKRVNTPLEWIEPKSR
jgi:hypothetical protein